MIDGAEPLTSVSCNDLLISCIILVLGIQVIDYGSRYVGCEGWTAR
jgi:hypothetical protein